MAKEVDFEWELPLESFVGSPVQLQGITIFHDFVWSSFFKRRAFPNGKPFTRKVLELNEDGKKPAILLTELQIGSFRSIVSETYTLLAFNVHDAMAARPNPADTVIGRGQEGRLLALNELSGVSIPSGRLDSFLSEHLTPVAVMRWVRADEAQRSELMVLLGEDTVNTSISTNESDIVRGPGRLGELDSDIVGALISCLKKMTDRESRLCALRSLTETLDGVEDAGRVFGERLLDRLDAAKKATDEFDALVASTTSTETDLQVFIQKHPWLIGLEYVQVRAKQGAPRGAMDFLLERYDGCHDILELKDPQDRIVDAVEAEGGRPPAAHATTLTKALAQAIAQSHDYRSGPRHYIKTIKVVQLEKHGGGIGVRPDNNVAFPGVCFSKDGGECRA